MGFCQHSDEALGAVKVRTVSFTQQNVKCLGVRCGIKRIFDNMVGLGFLWSLCILHASAV